MESPSRAADGAVRVFNAADGTCRKVLEGHSDIVRQVEFQDDTTLVSCSDDGSTKFWDISTGTPKIEVPGENFTFSKASAGSEQGAGHFLVSAKGNSVLVYHADCEANDGKEGGSCLVQCAKPCPIHRLHW